MTDPLLGGLLVASALLLVTILIARAPWERDVRLLVGAGLWLRVLGSLVYLYVIGAQYGGGDYLMYFDQGLVYAGLLGSGQFEAALAPWLESGWWGTSATIRLTGVVLAFVGPSLASAFVVFGVVSYIGIIACWLAFARSFPGANSTRYLAWIALFPSLWFWPAALGKDAIVLCGVGLAALGFAGRGKRKFWLLMALGFLLVFTIRPQVAAVLAFAIVAGHFLSVGSWWTLKKTLQGTALIIVGVATIILASGALDVELFDPDEVDGYLTHRGAALSQAGGSAIDVSGGGIPVWMAPVNVLFRPFVWEMRGIMPGIAGLEVLALWGIALWRRRQIAAFYRRHRNHKLFWFAVAMFVLYVVTLGLVATNIGLLARQRVHILPFLFMFIAGAPAVRRSKRRVPIRRPGVVPPRAEAPVLST